MQDFLRRLDLFAGLDPLFQIISVGAAFSASDRNDGSDFFTRVHHYEFTSQSYIQLPMERLFLRPGIRFGFDSLPNEGSPQWLNISERTHDGGIEMGIVFDGLLVPSLSWQSHLLARRLTLNTKGLVGSSSNHFPRTEWLSSNSVQLGLGLPIEGGKALIEPFYRKVWIQGDDRQNQRWGVEASWEFSLKK
jgi:hypothetical protein